MTCAAILRQVVVLIRTFVRVAREIITTVCGSVSSTVTVVREVCEELCGFAAVAPRTVYSRNLDDRLPPPPDSQS